MKKFRQIVLDIIYVSRLTKTKNKKILIFSSIVLSQLTAGTDLFLIAIFASIIADQYTNIDILNNAISIFIDNKLLIVLIVLLRYGINYSQFSILKKIEIDVTVNLKKYMFEKILLQKNYSTSDTYYFINTLTSHIAFFYSNFAGFLNHFLQALAYGAYLMISDISLISFFAIGGLVLAYPILKLIKAGRNYMHKTYIYGKDTNKDLVNAVENLPLIKILRMEKNELDKFSKIVRKTYDVAFKNYQIGFFNQQLPNFFTLTIFSFVLSIPRFVSQITLDFLGVTLRLFQSLSTVSSALSQVANAQIHIDEFIKIEKNNNIVNSEGFSLENSNSLELKDISFKYLNSETYIFENLNLKIQKNTHNLIVGSNGSGKSTLLGIIGNVLNPEKGKVTSFTNKLAYIGATPFIFATTLRENLLYGISQEIEDSEVLNLLKKFDIFKEKESYDLDRVIDNTSLSSGQMQKVAFVRALLSKPSLLLLDEAMANLDEESKKLVQEIVSNQNITVVNSTHDPDKFLNVDSIIKINIVDEKRIIDHTNQ